MTQRRFGPTLDAGTVILEKEAEKTIIPSALGSTGYPGILERGEIGALITVTGKRDLLKKTGGYIPDSLLPDACRDFWKDGEGAGTLFLYRVTHGDEVKATLNLYDRKASRNLVGKIDAQSGGSWGGKRDTHVLDVALVTDIKVTTIDLPIAFHPIYKDQFKDGYVTLTETGDSYKIVGNDESDGAAKTELRVGSDHDMDTDYGAGTDLEITITVPSENVYGEAKHLAVKIKDGQNKPTTEWGMTVYLDGNLVLDYPDLSSDPSSKIYWVSVINEDGNNIYITATEQWSGSITADVRPANHYGSVAASAFSAKDLDFSTAVPIVDYTNAGTNTIATFTFGASVIRDTYKLTYVIGTTDWTVESLNKQQHHDFLRATGGVAYAQDNPYSIGFTITEVGVQDGEYFTITVLPLVQSEAVGGRVFLIKPSDGSILGSKTGYAITANTEVNLTIVSGDMATDIGAEDPAEYRIQFEEELQDGYDGVASIDVNDFLPAYDTDTSPFSETADKGYGLIKFATPGITALPGALSGVDDQTIEKAGIAYANAKNHQYREEIPRTIVDETLARDYVLETLGRSNYVKVIFPSWAQVADPILAGLLKHVPITGMVHGRESLSAKNWDGFHKVAAGIDMTLPRIIKLPTGTKILDGEILNPAGLQRVVKKGGNWVIWGAQIPYLDAEWRFSQHRELMSYYEHVLIESNDWLMFQINDPEEQPKAIAALKSFFLPEWRKRALRGDSLEEACPIKIDEENNTDATRALGDFNAEIGPMYLADTIERFIITMSKAGVFATAA